MRDSWMCDDRLPRAFFRDLREYFFWRAETEAVVHGRGQEWAGWELRKK
jgi:hypothetical protein